MEFPSLSRRRSSARNVPSGERGETDVFAGFKANTLEIRSKRSCVTGGDLLCVCKALRAIPRHIKERRKYYWREILSPKTKPGPISLKGANKETLQISKGGQDKTQKLALAPQLG